MNPLWVGPIVLCVGVFLIILGVWIDEGLDFEENYSSTGYLIFFGIAIMGYGLYAEGKIIIEMFPGVIGSVSSAVLILLGSGFVLLSMVGIILKTPLLLVPALLLLFGLWSLLKWTYNSLFPEGIFKESAY